MAVFMHRNAPALYAKLSTSSNLNADQPISGSIVRAWKSTFPLSLIHRKFPSYAVLSTEPVILAQLIRGRGVSWPCLHVTMYYTAALFFSIYSLGFAVLYTIRVSL